MAPQPKRTGAPALRMIVGLALLLARPLLAAPPAPAPRPTMVLQVGHSAPITSFAYSPDGHTLASGGDDGNGGDGVRLWDTASGHLKATLPAESVLTLAFAPDGRTLASGGVDDNGNPVAWLWDVMGGQLKAILSLATGADTVSPPLAFSPDSKTLATGSGGEREIKGDGSVLNPYTAATVQLWDVASGQLKATLQPSVSRLDHLAFSPEGTTLVTGGEIDWWEPLTSSGTDPGPVQLWDAGTGQLKLSLDGAVGAFALSPDGKMLASWGEDDNANLVAGLWDVASGQREAVLGGVTGGWRVTGPFAFSSDGKALAAGGWDDNDDPVVQVWDVASKQVKAVLHGPTDWVNTLAFSPNGKTLAAGSVDNTGRLWDVASGQLQATLQGPTDTVTLVAFAPDGQTLATGSYDARTGAGDGTVRIWDVASGQLKAILEGRGEEVVNDAHLSPDGQTLVATDGVGARLWDTARGQLKATLKHVNAFAFSPDSQTLATASSNPATQFWTAQLWDPASGRLKATLTDVSDPLFSPDGKTLSAQSYDPTNHWTVRLWDAATGRLKATLPNASQPSPLFSPDSRALATKDGADVRLWDVAGGQLNETLKDAGFPLHFSPDGETLVTNDGPTVRLWDVASGQLRATLTLTGWSLPRAFSPDSRILATQDYNPTTNLYTLQLWDVARGQLEATLEVGPRTDWDRVGVQLAFSTDGKMLASRDDSGRLHVWDVASASPIVLTAETPLAPFPVWLTHPFYWSDANHGPARPEVWLLDPVDEHVLATLQALPDAPASLFAPPPDPAAAPLTGGNWITTTPEGYFEGSPNLAAFIRWSVDGALYPAAAYWDLYYRPDLVRQALRIPGG